MASRTRTKHALALLAEMRHNDSTSNVIICSSGICACAKGEQGHHALGLFVGRRHQYSLPNVINNNSGNSVCDKGQASGQGGLGGLEKAVKTT